MHSDIHAVEIVFLLLLFLRGRVRNAGAEAEDAVSDCAGDRRPAAQLYSGRSANYSESGHRLLRDSAAASLQRSVAHLVARIFLQSGQHLVSRLRPGDIYGAGRQLCRHWFLPGFDWRMGLVLGAVVAPTDAIAATSIAKRIGLPKRVVEILEGESLLNDAIALLALEFGIALLVGEQKTGFVSGAGRFAYLTVVGVLVGLVIGEIVHRVEHWIRRWARRDRAQHSDAVCGVPGRGGGDASGVLAVVVCGLYFGRKSSHFFSPNVRLQAWAVWDSLTFILNGLVFVLIGLQLPYVLRWDSRSQPERPAALRCGVQRVSDRTAVGVGVSRRTSGIFHQKALASSP